MANEKDKERALDEMPKKEITEVLKVQEEPQETRTLLWAVDSFLDFISSRHTPAEVANFLSTDISTLVGNEHVSFAHLLCLATGRLVCGDSTNYSAETLELCSRQSKGTSWFRPISLVSMELKYLAGTLSSLTDSELEAVQDFYDLHAFVDTRRFTLEFHRAGTTSIIFRCGHIALKVVRPVYLFDKQVCSLKSYAADYGHVELPSPKLHKATDIALSMDFVDGDTLLELMGQYAGAALMPARLKTSLIENLANLVAEIHRRGHPHGDLNPSNIIVKCRGEHVDRMTLIDYGYNYCISRPLLSAEAHPAAVRYIAPSCAGKGGDAIYRDDVYSLGVLMLDVWFCQSEREPDIYDLVDDLARERPEFAFAVEDCLPQDPRYRMVKLAGPDEAASQLSGVLCAAVKYAMSVPPNKPGPGVLALLDAQAEVFRAIKRIDGDDAEVAFSADKLTNRRLNLFSAVCRAFTAIVLLLVVSAGVEALRGGHSYFAEIHDFWYVRGLGWTSGNASVLELMPGYLVCGSFLILASKYYLWIFASLAPGQVDAWGAEISARWNSFCYMLPISYCFVLDPKTWPFCSAVGLFFVAANNRVMRHMLKSITASVHFGKLAVAKSRSTTEIYSIFAVWDMMVFWYAAGLVLTGIVVFSSEPARSPLLDEWLDLAGQNYNVYEWLLAFVALAINYFKMQRENCGRFAPKVKLMIQRHLEAAKAIRTLSRGSSMS